MARALRSGQPERFETTSISHRAGAPEPNQLGMVHTKESGKVDAGTTAHRAASPWPCIGELLVAKGFDPDVPIRDQETPLTMACRADKAEHPGVVAALLKLGADPNAPNAKGKNPLAIATSARFNETVALLKAAGAG
jgi:ankyrin repeat protein